MNKKFLSFLSLALSLCLVAVMVAGCSGTTTTPESTPAATAEATDSGTGDATTPDTGTKVSFVQYWDMPSHNVNMQTDIAVELMKRTNVDVTYEVPTSDDGQKLNIMMSSGDLPEIITCDRTNAAVGKMIDAGAVYCINDLMEQYYPSMLTDIEPEYFTYHKYKDGKNYYWTNYIYTPWVLNHEDWPKVEAVFQCTSIRTDIYEAIGKPDVSTPEAYKAMLQQVKDAYPDLPTLYMPGFPTSSNGGTIFMNGDSPSYLFTGEWGLSRYDVDDSSNVTSVIRNDKFKEMVSFMNDLYNSGLLDASSFIDNGDVVGQKIDNGQVAVFHGSIGNHAFTAGVGYTPLPFFTEINGEAAKGQFVKSGAGWLATMVTTKTTGSVLEGVMRFLGYQTTMEGRQLCGWGIEGVHWEWNADKTEPVKTAIWDNMADPSDNTKKWGFWQNRAMHDQYYCNSLFEKWTDERKAWYAIYGDAMVLDIFDGVRNPALDNSDEGLILAKLNDVFFSDFPKLIMGSADTFSADYDAFVAKCDSLGLPTLEAYWTQKYQLFNGSDNS